MTWLETSRLVPAAASRWNRSHSSTRSTGSRPTVGSSSTSSSGSRAARRPARPGCAGRRRASPTSCVGLRAEPVASMTRSTSPAGAPSTRAEVVEVLPHGEVVVDARPPGSRSRRGGAGRGARPAGRAPSTVPVVDPLHADDRAHQRGLAAAARAEQPDTWPRGIVQVEAVQHRVLPAAHAQARCRPRHPTNSSCDELFASCAAAVKPSADADQVPLDDRPDPPHQLVDRGARERLGLHAVARSA